MSRKQRGALRTVLIGAVTGVAAEYIVREALTMAWTRATGEAPPTDLESPETGLGHAVGWAVLAGVGGEVTRVLVMRAVHQRTRS